jgi:putative copper export protein
MPIALGLIHGIDFALGNWLIGVTVFCCFILTAGGSGAEAVLTDWPKRIRELIGLTFLSSLLWTLFTSSDMAQSWSPSDLWLALTHTSFGHFWCMKLSLLVILFLTAQWLNQNRVLDLGFLALVLLLPVFSVLTGHAGAQKQFVLFRVLIDWSHSLAVGVWSGGLWMLYVWLGRRLSIKQIVPGISYRVVKRFSHFAMASTGIIGFSGLLMAYLAGVSLLHPWATSYGLLIIGKVFLFTAALLAAAGNQFIHLRSWTPEREAEFAHGVRREVRLELGFLLVVFILAGFLARTSMPVG